MADDNVIFIGGKNFLNYVTAVTTQFQDNNRKEVVIKARGKFISRAVDVSEIVIRKFMKEAEIVGIKTGSEEFKNDNGKNTFVSTIEIKIKRE